MARKFFELKVAMAIDVDGAPNAYGAKDALDHELNARAWKNRKPTEVVVGYRTRDGTCRTPVLQKGCDPCPGFYVSETSYFDARNANEDDPRRYVNAAEINYTLRAKAARAAGVQLGDFCAVHSLSTGFVVYAIVGDSGNSGGEEGSLALLQRLGYPAKNGKAGGVEKREIVVRYFPGSNPERRFFFTQVELDSAARALALDVDFSSYHAGDAGKLVLDAVPVTGSTSRIRRERPFAPLAKKSKAPCYPGCVARRDSKDRAAVMLIQQRLRDLGFMQQTRRGRVPLVVDGEFGAATADAVELFQIRHTDLEGESLKVDGEVGATTWAAFFGRVAVHFSKAGRGDKLLAAALAVAIEEIGVREDPIGSNRGPRVVEYLRAVGVDPGNAWCAAFVFFCYAEASRKLRRANPVLKCGGVLAHWNEARARGIRTLGHDDAIDDPSRIKPGMIFVISTGGGFGHTGLVSRVLGGKLETIEGNTNDGGSREGIGVFRRTGRTIDSINRGFIDYSKA